MLTHTYVAKLIHQILCSPNSNISYVVSYIIILFCMFCHTGESLGPQHIHGSTSEEIVNTAYDTITDHHLKKPAVEPIGCYAEVVIPSNLR